MLTNASITAYLFVQDTVRRLQDDARGATIIEYSLLIGLLTIAVIASILLVQGWIAAAWNALVNHLGTNPS